MRINQEAVSLHRVIFVNHYFVNLPPRTQNGSFKGKENGRQKWAKVRRRTNGNEGRS